MTMKKASPHPDFWQRARRVLMELSLIPDDLEAREIILTIQSHLDNAYYDGWHAHRKGVPEPSQHIRPSFNEIRKQKAADLRKERAKKRVLDKVKARTP
jgi:hypothetical protein